LRTPDLPENVASVQAGGGCCSGVSRAPLPARTAALTPQANPSRDDRMTMSIPGGRAEVGTDKPVFGIDGEGPRRFVKLSPFRMDETTVTNDRFNHFVRETGYVTDAERFGWSFVFQNDIEGDKTGLQRVAGAEWWCRVEGACWNHPEGPASSVEQRGDHPVTHVSYNDAVAFAAWTGGRLPTEPEWEHAARGGRSGATFPWGDTEPDDETHLPCNIWQGRFPDLNSGRDGYSGTAPARSFESNGYGLYNMCGNVWEWSASPWRLRSLGRTARSINATSAAEGHRILKGGSFLCHRSYCYRYRIAARIGNTPDTSTSHIGIRVAYDHL
jgi:formylglycine-generating enzyme